MASEDRTITGDESLSSKLEPVEPAVDSLWDDKPPDTFKIQQEAKLSTLTRYSLLFLFCLGQFMDAYNGSALFTAIPTLVNHLGFTPAESPWIVSAYQLTLASFLLIVSLPSFFLVSMSG